MLYPTHQKYGIFFGICMIPVSVFLGFIPTLSSDMRITDLVLILCACFMGMSGALFGARFPDCDSATSIPAKRHPIIRKIFVTFHVKHRGKYSHDYFWIGVTYALALFFVHKLGNRALEFLVEGNVLANYLTYLVGSFFLYIIGQDIVDFLQWIANKLGNKKMWAILNTKRSFVSIGLIILTFLCLYVGKVISIEDTIKGQDLATTLTIATILFVVVKIYVLFAWAGSYSHLFADMTTKDGVSIFGKKLAPARVILKVKKIPLIGKLLIPTEFKTGSKWEDFNALVISIACVPASIIALLVLVGFDLSFIFNLGKVK